MEREKEGKYEDNDIVMKEDDKDDDTEMIMRTCLIWVSLSLEEKKILLYNNNNNGFMEKDTLSEWRK